MFSVSEIFKSIQGESSFCGQVCSFVRLAGCNLRCAWCDTAYAWEGGETMTMDAVVCRITDHNTRLVEITGGEPLVQPETPQLCRHLLETNHTVLVETNGTLDIDMLPEGVVRIMDIKCPSSGMADRFHAPNAGKLTSRDEVKFVIADREDFIWALDVVKLHRLDRRCTVVMSPAWNKLPLDKLAAWILKADAPIRMGIPLHKVIWGERRGV
jgi:7-carboxy-7-deazaguanine synthase